LSSPPIKEEDIACQVVLRDPILVAVPRTHHLVDRGRVSLSELKDEYFVGVVGIRIYSAVFSNKIAYLLILRYKYTTIPISRYHQLTLSQSNDAL
jgi:hypothetical protein